MALMQRTVPAVEGEHEGQRGLAVPALGHVKDVATAPLLPRVRRAALRPVKTHATRELRVRVRVRDGLGLR